MEAVCSSKTQSLIFQTTLNYIPEEFWHHCCENVESKLKKGLDFR